MLNNICLTGRLTKDPEIRYTTNNKAVASFRLAVKRDYGDATDFIDCVAWEKKAEFIDQYFTKGMLMTVVGRLETRTWESDKGKRTVYEVNADHVFFAESKKKDEATPPPGFEPVADDGDLPF